MAHANSNTDAVVKVYGELVSAKYQDPVVVSADAVFDYGRGKSQEEINEEGGFYFGDIEPEFKKTLWVSNNDTTEYHEDNTIIQNLYRRMSEIETIVSRFQNIINYGVIAGDSTVGGRTNIMSTATPINPSGEEDTEDPEAIQPTELGNTVPNISVKKDTAANFSEHYQNLIDSELIWITDQNKLFIYINGTFKPVGGSGGGSGEGMSAEEIMAMFFDYLGLKTETGDNYRIAIDGHEVLRVYCAEAAELVLDSGGDTFGVWVSGRLFINSIFVGGNGDARSYQCCSHNFVELANCSGHDINLNGLYLLYAPNKDTTWKSLALKGKIKSGSTFLIRGKQCSAKTNTTIINVDEYDMEWRDGNDFISFAQESPVFYLAWGDHNQFYNASEELVPFNELTRVVWNENTLLKGYVDSVGISTGSAAEGNSPVSITTGDSWSDLLFVRTFTLDPVSQANKGYVSRKSSNLWTYVNLVKNADETLINPRYYYNLSSKLKFVPRNGSSGKDIFTTKTVFREDKPNMLNITFGRQATYKDAKHTATRCFNWVSVGYYDEYLEYTTVSDTDWHNSTSIHSITDSSIVEGGEYYTNNVVTTFIEQYKRIRWVTTSGTAVTTHKVIIFGLTNGTYKYRVKRTSDTSYESDVLQFTVRSDSQVSSFKFVQTSDQQGFNWLEYQVWKKAALCISNEHSDIQFTINTGDITQNGNRENEWLDYYDGRQFLRDKEEMFTIGNNDLCGVKEYQLGDGTAGTYKINHKNITFYYTFELDPNNSTIFTSGNTTYCMPSLYSFDYGLFHFVSINSEFANNTYKCYQSEAGTFITDTYSQMADWFKKDLQQWKGISSSEEPSDCSKCIVFCHEMPYTIITRATRLGSSGRGGSKLNTIATKGKTYYWSRIFKQYGIRLVMGGHKHTYSMTYPCYDAPEGYIKNDHTVDQNVDFFGSISNADSMKPVVQVTSSSAINENSESARYELVNSINAPLYVMCQATGYKLVSNKELPCDNTDNTLSVDWLKKCFPGTHPQDPETGVIRDKANPYQYRPTYILYNISASQINVTSYQVQYAYSEPTASKAGSFNINNQQTHSLTKLEIENGNYEINI